MELKGALRTTCEVKLFDGVCDQTKKLKTLSSSMTGNKWITYSSGHYMFVRFDPPYDVSHELHNGSRIDIGFNSTFHYGKTFQTCFNN